MTAIIGGGIGGTSAAHFMRKKFGSSANISIFESNQIGGRLATTVMAGKEYEVGGSIVHSANKLMNEFLEETGKWIFFLVAVILILIYLFVGL